MPGPMPSCGIAWCLSNLDFNMSTGAAFGLQFIPRRLLGNGETMT